jgi:hypothetical protein
VEGGGNTGRYTLPVLLWRWRRSLCDRKAKLHYQYKVVLAGVFIVGYVYGGGVGGWIIGSDETWRWENQTVQSINNTSQQLLKANCTALARSFCCHFSIGSALLGFLVFPASSLVDLLTSH